ncbi:hypothetical protein ACSLBF_16745 [Pseudoalteromonas sp. T1lg65]|uniref:hypothetical protein n=1 Tax=Pseudoalteromonas sp. T1lg65 TaxID=2077101 RepID=UPI003F7AC165
MNNWSYWIKVTGIFMPPLILLFVYYGENGISPFNYLFSGFPNLYPTSVVLGLLLYIVGTVKQSKAKPDINGKVDTLLSWIGGFYLISSTAFYIVLRLILDM